MLASRGGGLGETMKPLTALAILIASTTLTTVGAIVFFIVAAIGVAAFVMALRLKRVVDDLEAAVGEQALKIAEITGHLAGD